MADPRKGAAMGLSRCMTIVWLAAGMIVAAVLLTAMVILDQPLRTAAAPRGIVSLELAGSPAIAQAILESWGPDGRRQALLSLRLDYVFLMAYALVLWRLCRMVATAWPDRLRLARRAGYIAGNAQWAAALLDVIENIMLQSILAGSPAAFPPLVARWCALVKFSLIGCAWVYLVLAGGMRIIFFWSSRNSRSSP